MKNKLNIHYDKEADILELRFGKPTKSYFEEVEAGIFKRIDEKTKKIMGLTIISFMKRTGKIGELNVDLPEEIRLIS